MGVEKEEDNAERREELQPGEGSSMAEGGDRLCGGERTGIVLEVGAQDGPDQDIRDCREPLRILKQGEGVDPMREGM